MFRRSCGRLSGRTQAGSVAITLAVLMFCLTMFRPTMFCQMMSRQAQAQQMQLQTLSPATASGQALTPGTTQDNQSAPAPLVLTLQDALNRAKANDPHFRAALTDLGVAHQDTVQSRAQLLPNVNYNMQYLYTQPKDSAGNVAFIANNGVHEYIAQGNVHQALSPGMWADYRRVAAAESIARAKAQIATRGLVVTVVQNYYGYIVAQRKYATAQKAAAEADHFFGITQKLQNGGEVARSDVIKAQIQNLQLQRESQQAIGNEQNPSRPCGVTVPEFRAELFRRG
jgi:outer membrane protein TolC